MAQNPRRITVTGAKGFLGTYVMNGLSAAGSGNVSAIAPCSRAATAQNRHGSEGGASTFPVPQGTDTLVHLAWRGVPATSSGRFLKDADENVVAAVALFNEARAAGVRKIIFASSGGTVYGDRALPLLAEDLPPRPQNAYAKAKATVESYLQSFAEAHGLTAIVLRIANAYGPGQRAGKGQGLVAAAMAAALTGDALPVWGNGSATRDYVFARDVADAVLGAVIYEGPSSTFNVGSGEGRSVLDVVGAVEQLLGRSVRIEWRPARDFDLARNVLDVRRIKSAFGWTAATSFADGLSQTAEWMMAELERPGATSRFKPRSAAP